MAGGNEGGGGEGEGGGGGLGDGERGGGGGLGGSEGGGTGGGIGGELGGGASMSESSTASVRGTPSSASTSGIAYTSDEPTAVCMEPRYMGLRQPRRFACTYTA